MLDIHAHLHFKDYDADRDAVIVRAREAGVEQMILVGTDLETSHAAVELAEKHDFLYASVGVHPHEFNGYPSSISPYRKGEVSCLRDGGARVDEKNITPHPALFGQRAGSSPFGKGEREYAALRELAKHPKVVAIGECGLDYFSRDPERPITGDQKAWQREGFLALMETAKELGLPMIIHTRPSAGTMDAYEDIFGILQSEIVNMKSTILHCYQGDTEVTKKLLLLPNAYFSFTGSITYPVKKAIAGTKDDPAKVLKMISAERIFVETDCPYLAPQLVRGTRNEPAYVTMTVRTVADLLGMTEGAFETTLSDNFRRVFMV